MVETRAELPFTGDQVGLFRAEPGRPKQTCNPSPINGNIVPHLTVVQVADDRQFDRIAGEFARAAQRKLPIRATVREISLMTGWEGIWVVHTNFALGEGDCP